MFSQQLENLIQATLEDGVLEDHEKAALVKRAQAEGVDLIELEIYINSILQKRQKEADAKKAAVMQAKQREKQEAFGSRCPNCGKQVPPMTLKCECGYEFTTKKQVASVQDLADRILEIQTRAFDKTTKNQSTNIFQSSPLYKKIYENQVENQKDKMIIDLITLFPVPNTKEDIVEFLSVAVTNSKQKGGLWGSHIGRILILIIIAVIASTLIMITVGDKGGAPLAIMATLFIVIYGGFACFLTNQDPIRSNKRAKTWRNKFDQVLLKGRSLRGDSDFQHQLDYYEQLANKK